MCLYGMYGAGLRGTWKGKTDRRRQGETEDDGRRREKRWVSCRKRMYIGHHNIEQRLYCSATFHHLYLSILPQMHSKPDSLITDCLQTKKTELNNNMVLTVHGFIITAQIQTKYWRALASKMKHLITKLVFLVDKLQNHSIKMIVEEHFSSHYTFAFNSRLCALMMRHFWILIIAI